MKKAVYFMAATAVLLALSSCSKEQGNGGGEGGNVLEASVNASVSGVWQYFSFAEGKVVGSGKEDETDNAAWAARTDWDIAINRYSIRTNSGEASSTAAKGGVYTFDSTVTFDSVAEVPAGATFSTDKAVTSEGMGGTTTTVKSEATVILFKTDAEGNKVMPPVYLQAPVYLFRSADGNHCYKVLFTQYQDENKESGHVIFSFAEVK